MKVQIISLSVFVVYFNTNINVSVCASLDETQTWNCLNLAGFKCINDLQLLLKKQ